MIKRPFEEPSYVTEALRLNCTFIHSNLKLTPYEVPVGFASGFDLKTQKSIYLQLRLLSNVKKCLVLGRRAEKISSEYIAELLQSPKLFQSWYWKVKKAGKMLSYMNYVNEISSMLEDFFQSQNIEINQDNQYEIAKSFIGKQVQAMLQIQDPSLLIDLHLFVSVFAQLAGKRKISLSHVQFKEKDFVAENFGLGDAQVASWSDAQAYQSLHVLQKMDFFRYFRFSEAQLANLSLIKKARGHFAQMQSDFAERYEEGQKNFDIPDNEELFQTLLAVTSDLRSFFKFGIFTQFDDVFYEYLLKFSEKGNWAEATKKLRRLIEFFIYFQPPQRMHEKFFSTLRQSKEIEEAFYVILASHYSWKQIVIVRDQFIKKVHSFFLERLQFLSDVFIGADQSKKEEFPSVFAVFDAYYTFISNDKRNFNESDYLQVLTFFRNMLTETDSLNGALIQVAVLQFIPLVSHDVVLQQSDTIMMIDQIGEDLGHPLLSFSSIPSKTLYKLKGSQFGNYLIQESVINISGRHVTVKYHDLVEAYKQWTQTVDR